MNKIKKNDSVMVLLGKDSGKTGKVEKILTKEDKVYIVGVNMVKRHVRGREGVEGGIIEIIKPLNISNVALICPNCGKATKVGFELGKDGKKMRVCKKCGKEIK